MTHFLRPHELQNARLPCPSLSPGVCSNSCQLSWWCHPTISSSIILFSFCLQSFPASAISPWGNCSPSPILPSPSSLRAGPVLYLLLHFQLQARPWKMIVQPVLAEWSHLPVPSFSLSYVSQGRPSLLVNQQWDWWEVIKSGDKNRKTIKFVERDWSSEVVPRLDDTQIPPEEGKCRFPGPDLGPCRALHFYWAPLVIPMQEGSEKYLAGNLGEQLGILDHLPLILFHKRYIISAKIKILRTALASATLITASLLESQASEFLISSGTQSLAVAVAALMAAVVVRSRMVVLLAGKAWEICKFSAKWLEILGWSCYILFPSLGERRKWGAGLCSSLTGRGVTRGDARSTKSSALHLNPDCVPEQCCDLNLISSSTIRKKWITGTKKFLSSKRHII